MTSRGPDGAAIFDELLTLLPEIWHGATSAPTAEDATPPHPEIRCHSCTAVGAALALSADFSGKMDWHFFRHGRNQGKSDALRTTIEHAERELSVVHDADLTYHLRDLLQMILLDSCRKTRTPPSVRVSWQAGSNVRWPSSTRFRRILPQWRLPARSCADLS